MHREAIDPALLVNLNRRQVHEGIGVEDAHRAVRRGGEEVAREREVGRGVEAEGGDRSGMVVEGAEGGGRRQVVEVDGVVAGAGGRDGAGGGDGRDRGEVGGVAEELG